MIIMLLKIYVIGEIKLCIILSIVKFNFHVERLIMLFNQNQEGSLTYLNKYHC